jgi:hypothetical protein
MHRQSTAAVDIGQQLLFTAGKKKPLVERGLQFRTKENNIKNVGGLLNP